MFEGEYHTFIVDGPLFKKRIEILDANEIARDDHWFLDMLEFEIR